MKKMVLLAVIIALANGAEAATSSGLERIERALVQKGQCELLFDELSEQMTDRVAQEGPDEEILQLYAVGFVDLTPAETLSESVVLQAFLE